MSAIAGLLHTDGRSVTAEALEAIAAAAPPRGQDGVSLWRDGSFGTLRFAHATTPEAVGEVQPFIGESGAILMFDGRIDNRAELLERIGAGADRLRGAPDGRIVLALFERVGRDFVRLLAGDFAIAIREPDARRLSLFRSPLGWRPLYWTCDGSSIAFATDVRSMVVGLKLERRLNEGALAEFLAGRYVTETETFWGNIQRVPQGGAVLFEGGGEPRIRAWHGGPFEDWHGRSMDDHVERFTELFDSALIAVSRSTGPVTSQLSGGLDSSAIVCRAAELHRAGRLDRPFGAISARFPGEPHDETEYSSAVEAHLGITAEAIGGTPFSIEGAQAWTAQTYQLPLRPNALDTMAGAVMTLGASGRRVLLTGEGGDDWLNGSLAHWPDLLVRGRWPSLLEHGRKHWPDAPWIISALKTVYTAARPVVSPRYRQALLRPHLDWRIPAVRWLRPEWTRKVDLEDRWRQLLPREGLRGFTQRARYTTFTFGNRQVISEAAIAFAESQGVEVRHPLHDARLTRFLVGASGNLMLVKNYRKLILREAMRGTLPEMVRTRTTKAAFTNHSIDAHEALFERRPPSELLPVKLGWMDGKALAALHEPYRKWRREGSQGEFPAQPMGPIWFALATDMWLQHAFGID